MKTVNKTTLAAVAASCFWGASLVGRLILGSVCPIGSCRCSYDSVHTPLIDDVLWSIVMPLLVGLVVRVCGVKNAVRAVLLAAVGEFAVFVWVVNEGFHCFVKKKPPTFPDVPRCTRQDWHHVSLRPIVGSEKPMVAGFRRRSSGRWRLNRLRLQ